MKRLAKKTYFDQFLDIEKLKFHDWTTKGPGATNVELEFCDNIISVHIARSPDGACKKAHRHGPAPIFWYSKAKVTRSCGSGERKWKDMTGGPFSMFPPPHMCFTSTFNTAKEPLKMLAFKPFGQNFRISDYERLFVSTGQSSDRA